MSHTTFINKQRSTDLTDFARIIEKYNCQLSNIPVTYNECGAGVARAASGQLFEEFIDGLCKVANLDCRRNDYKRSEVVDGKSLKNLQVDVHGYRDGEMVKAVESKTYLDACYLKRAVSDFLELHSSPDVPKNVEYAIFSGQQCVSKESLEYYKALFRKKTDKELSIFVVNAEKRRRTKRPIYNTAYVNDFSLDLLEVENFVYFLSK